MLTITEVHRHSKVLAANKSNNKIQKQIIIVTQITILCDMMMCETIGTETNSSNDTVRERAHCSFIHSFTRYYYY